MTNLKVGDIIVIKDVGGCFSTYKEWAKKYGLNNFKSGDTPTINNRFKVKIIADHLGEGVFTADQYKKMLGIIDLETKQEYIFSSFYKNCIEKEKNKQFEFSF